MNRAKLKKLITLSLMLILFLVPCFLAFCGYEKYLNIDTGNMLTVHYWGAVKLHEKEETIELPPYTDS